MTYLVNTVRPHLLFDTHYACAKDDVFGVNPTTWTPKEALGRAKVDVALWQVRADSQHRLPRILVGGVGADQKRIVSNRS